MSNSKARRPDFFISIDLEANGPCPGMNSMLQLGAVFYSPTGEVCHEYSANIEELPGAVSDPSTMKWWAEQEIIRPGIWDRMMQDRLKPELAMQRFESAVAEVSHKYNAKPLCVAYPAGYDFTWLYWYLCKFTGQSCVGFSCLDMKTLSMALIQRSYSESTKSRFPKHWFNPKLKHTHNALDDARGQGHTFFEMKKQLQSVWDAMNFWDSRIAGDKEKAAGDYAYRTDD